MRIVSLLPSATEIICELGLDDQLVGVSHECDYPIGVEQLPRVTSSVIPKNVASADIDRLVREHLQNNASLYLLDLELLEKLAPDLIVTQALCDVCAVSSDDVEAAVHALPSRPAVVNLEPSQLEDVFRTIERVGAAAAVPRVARNLVTELGSRIQAVVERTAKVTNHPKVVFLEWIDPPFSAGHWTPELIEFAGGIDCLGNAGSPSRTLQWSEIVAAQPDVLIAACCGFDADRTAQDADILARQAGWNELPCVQAGRVVYLDGNAYFNRPGPRLVDSLELLAHHLHPDIHRFPVTGSGPR
jgi:iron complex transport system substrate-binding protein